MTDQSTPLVAVAHGASRLPAVDVDSYNVELRDGDDFLGDRANKSAFRAMVEGHRQAIEEEGDDPFGDKAIDDMSNKELDKLARKDDDAAEVVNKAIADFSGELVLVLRRMLKLSAWRDTERIVVGGGFRATRFGEAAIGLTAKLLNKEKFGLEFQPIRNDPDEAGLMGSAQLVPSWILAGHDAILAVDIGGTNIRAGVVLLDTKTDSGLPKAKVWQFDRWKHGNEKKLSRTEAIDGLIDMLRDLIERAEKEKIGLAPFIGIGCPGKIEEDGAIDRGAQNLPGDWTSSRFNLPEALHKAIPEIRDQETTIVMHNDAVVQGLSEAPYMRDVEHWGVLTIGTGLGNARFTNRRDKD